jgi:LPPG:FO 2-phospho-L-lactate transferase
MRVVALAGGVGGAKLVYGLSRVLKGDELTVVVNTGDDFEHWGLFICPDLDTVCYALAGLENPETGWGRAEESWNVLQEMRTLGAADWFALGDRDLATHLERSYRLRSGQRLSEITAQFCLKWGIDCRVLPMSDDSAPTFVETVDEGILPFQEYFVRLRCQPRVRGFDLSYARQAMPAMGVLEAIAEADVVIVCPSNPWVSIGPILAMPGILNALKAHACVVAVSPLIGGTAVKGPAAKMFQELGFEPGVMAVAECYRDFLRAMIIDFRDKKCGELLTQWGIIPYITDTYMSDKSQRHRLAREILEFCQFLLKGSL